MAFDAFLKIEGVPGESKDSKHSEWIEVISYQMGVDQPASASASSVGSLSAERANWRQFIVNKQIDKGSPKLAQACASGEHYPTVTLEVCRAGGDKQPYMEYKLTDVMVSSFSVGAAKSDGNGGDPVPIETLQFNYGKIEFKYTQLDVAGGKPAGNVAAGWDLKTNKKV
jgi:type VI secretion system secreted protein Hcp